MELGDFRTLVSRLAAQVPAEYLDGVVAIEVSPKAVPHPVYPSVYTLGECIPVETADDPPPSRVVLYYGSFRALAGQRGDFDWRAEAWETLTHELKHHLERRARTGQLEAYDWAAEQNFRRQEGEPFDPLFYQWGERLGDGVYQVDDDVFWDRPVRGRPPARLALTWHGRPYQVELPDRPLPLYLVVEGLEPEPAGEAIVVVRARPRLWDLFRRVRQPVAERVRAQPAD